MQPQLEGKVDKGPENQAFWMGVGIIAVAIILIIMALCTNVFNSDDALFYVSGDGIDHEQEDIEKIFDADNNDDDTPPQISGDEDDLFVYFFDVGQGDCTFIENKGFTMLIDAGNNPDGKYISKYLRNTLKIDTINYLVATHSHEDHIGGMDIIIEDFNVENFFIPAQKVESKSYNDVIDWADIKELDAVSPEIGREFYVGDAVCRIVAKDDITDDLNASSIVIELTYKGKKFLFTGDMIAEKEEARTWDDIDVLTVAHHGSTYSSTQDFLNQTLPEIAVISCGRDNDYYYPHEAVLRRLENVGCEEIYITSEDNTVIITTDGNTITAQTQAIILDGNTEK